MRVRKAVAMALAVVAVTSLALGSAGFSSVRADRSVSVSVVDDQHAFVGYHTSDREVQDGESNVKLVRVANRFPGDVAVTNVSIDAQGVSFTDVTQPSLSPGDRSWIEGTVQCTGENAETTVAVTVTVEGTGVLATVYGDTQTREFDLTCATSAGEDESSPPFNGRFTGSATFSPDDLTHTVTVDYWTMQSNDGSFEKYTNETLGRDDNLHLTGNEKLVAVAPQGDDGAFVHPGFDLVNETFDNSSTGAGVWHDGDLELGD